MQFSNVPPCFESDKIEMYRYNGELKVIMNGTKSKFCELPKKYRKPFEQEFSDDETVQLCLSEKMKVKENRFNKFLSCRYGNFDSTPDLIDGITYPDAPNCEHEKTCPGFGIVCLIPGGLTPQEYFITRLIGLGKQDIEIAEELGNTVATIRTHYTHIRVKLDKNNRNEVGKWARDKGFV